MSHILNFMFREPSSKFLFHLSSEKQQDRSRRSTAPIVVLPTFEKELVDVKVNEGEPITLECTAAGKLSYAVNI